MLTEMVDTWPYGAAMCEQGVNVHIDYRIKLTFLLLNIEDITKHIY